jgi:hypothetical protein
VLRRADELSHPASAGSEVWDLAVVDPHHRVAVAVELRVADGRAAYAAAVVTDEAPVVALVADDLVAPRGGLELRGPGIWADQVCEEPGARWTLGLEAFAVALDDPADAVGEARGHPTPLGFDLDLDDVAAAAGAGADGADGAVDAPDGVAAVVGGYRRPCRLRGELLVGAGRLELDAWGYRGHVWGGGRGRAAEGTAGWWLPAGSGGHARTVGPDQVPDDAPVVGAAWLPGPRRGRVLRWADAAGTGVGWRWDRP